MTPDDLARIEARASSTIGYFGVAQAQADTAALIAYARELEAERDTLLDNLDDERVILGDALRERDDARAAIARVTALCDAVRLVGVLPANAIRAAIAGPTPTEGDDRG